jgi:hypothetical protein
VTWLNSMLSKINREGTHKNLRGGEGINADGEDQDTCRQSDFEHQIQ